MADHPINNNNSTDYVNADNMAAPPSTVGGGGGNEATTSNKKTTTTTKTPSERSEENKDLVDARPILPWISFFTGDWRDGLPMLNMQAAFLISARQYSEKQVGVLFLVFGLSQFLCMSPAGYYLDYTNNKLQLYTISAFLTSLGTVMTAVTAAPEGRNILWIIFWKVLQGATTAITTPGFHSITLGIVGSTGFTKQVALNRQYNHLGTALVVTVGSIIAFTLYPDLGALFIVSPLAFFAALWNLRRITPAMVHKDAARGLIIESPTMTEYVQRDEEHAAAAIIATSLIAEENGKLAESDGLVKRSSYLPPVFLSAALEPPASVLTFSSPAALADWAAAEREAAELAAAALEEERQRIASAGRKADRRKKVIRPPATQLRSPHQLGRSAQSTGSSAESSKSVLKSYGSYPSFNLGWFHGGASRDGTEDDITKRSKRDTPVDIDSQLRARAPLAVLLDPTLLIFTSVVFFFHLANSSVLPLVMQTLALSDARTGILLSGLCITIAQTFMAFFASMCGRYSPMIGRKPLLVVGLGSLPIRCFLLTYLVNKQDLAQTDSQRQLINFFILTTQFLDSVGAGIFGTLQVLITGDISGGTGRFSLMLGITTSAICLGATFSGYIGQAVAQDYGYPFAFATLGTMSLIPFFLYLFFVPETLPDYVRPQPEKQRRRLALLLLRKLNDQQLRISHQQYNNSGSSAFRRGQRGVGNDNELREQLNPSSSETASDATPAQHNRGLQRNSHTSNTLV